MSGTHDPSRPSRESQPLTGTTPATIDVAARGLEHRIIRHGRVGSLEEAAELRGVGPGAIIKTLVLRRAEDDYIFVLVPGDRVIAWPRLRSLLGVSRLSMPDADTAKAVTGYERGTITPFGATNPWPVVADARIVGTTVSMGGGAHGVSLTMSADDVVASLAATVADVTDPR